MPGKSPALKLIGPFFASLCVLSSLTLGAAPAAAGAACPAGTLGPERTLALGTKGGFAIGLKTYPQTLDLADHEVVLTFDDGPSPKTTPLVLDALAKQCVHATFFLIGRNAAAHPALVRREVADGETLGNHTFSHPARTLRLMSEKAAEADIEKGAGRLWRRARSTEDWLLPVNWTGRHYPTPIRAWSTHEFDWACAMDLGPGSLTDATLAQLQDALHPGHDMVGTPPLNPHLAERYDQS